MSTPQTQAIVSNLSNRALATLQALVEGTRLPPRYATTLPELTEQFPLVNPHDLRPTPLGRACMDTWRATFGARAT